MKTFHDAWRLNLQHTEGIRATERGGGRINACQIQEETSRITQRYFNNKTFSLCLFVTFAFIDFSSSPLQDLGTLVEQLARFLGVSCDKAQLEGMVESCNQLIEQCCNSEALSMCRGEWERKAQLFCSGHRQHKTCTYRLRHQPLV